VTNEPEEPEDGKALFITYRGRDWICLWSKSGYTLFPADSKGAFRPEADAVYRYLKGEGFIDDDDQPAEKFSQQ